MTQEEIIINYLTITRNGEWVKEGLVRGIDTEWGYLGFRGDRTVREMIKKRLLEKDNDGKYRIVRVKPKLTAYVMKHKAYEKVERKPQQVLI